MPIQLNDDTIEIISINRTYTIDKSYDDSNVISLLSTSNITFLEGGGGGLNVDGNINFTGNLTKNDDVFSSYDDNDVISILSTSNITFLEGGGGGLNVDGNINFTGNLTKNDDVFSSYNDTDVISLLSTSNITLYNNNIGIGKTEPDTTIDVVGNINISTGSKYQVDGSDLSFNDIQGTLGLDKGGIGTSLASIDELKALLDIGISSEYEITDISPAYFNLTTSGDNKGISNQNGEDYMKPMTFTIYGKNFDKNIRIKIVDNFDTLHSYINTIYYDSSVKIRTVTKYIKVSEVNQVDKYPYKIKIYHKDDITKHAFSGDIYKDEAIPSWSQTYDNVIYDISQEPGFSFNFSLTDSDDPNTKTYSLADGDFLPEWLNLNSETGTLSGDPPNYDLTSYSGSSRETYQLTINAISGTIELSHLVNFHILTAPTWSTPSEVELSENTFTLEAVSDADSILGTPTNITYSIETNSDADNISLSGNTINVTELESLGESGKNITVRATDAYGYSSNKTINIINAIGSNIIYAWGYNEVGNLGLGNYGNPVTTPTIIPFFRDSSIRVVKIVSHYYIGTLFITSTGDVYACGPNEGTRFSNVVPSNNNSPKLITYLNTWNVKIVDAFLTYRCAAYISDTGDVYVCGYDSEYSRGKLGKPSAGNVVIPTRIDYFKNQNIKIKQVYFISDTISTTIGDGGFGLFLTTTGVLYEAGWTKTGYASNGPQLFNAFIGIEIEKIIGGHYHVIIISVDGRCWTYGANVGGRLGDGNNGSWNDGIFLYQIPQSTFDNQPVIDADSLSNGSIFLTATSKYGCGYNRSYAISPYLTVDYFPTLQKNTYWGASKFPLKIKSSNDDCVFIETTDGKKYIQGTNEYGLLGNGSTQSNQYPTEITYFSTYGIEILDIFKTTRCFFVLKK